MTVSVSSLMIKAPPLDQKLSSYYSSSALDLCVSWVSLQQANTWQDWLIPTNWQLATKTPSLTSCWQQLKSIHWKKVSLFTDQLWLSFSEPVVLTWGWYRKILHGVGLGHTAHEPVRVASNHVIKSVTSGFVRGVQWLMACLTTSSLLRYQQTT